MRNQKDKAESRIQMEIVMMVRNHHQQHVIFSVPNESETSREAMRKKATGLMAGVSDLIMLTPYGETIFIEVKTPTGKQSPRQERFQAKVTLMGFQYHVVRSVEEVERIIRA